MGRVPGIYAGNYLGTAMPPPGWLRQHPGVELTCTLGHYWIDSGHKREGHHLVVVDGELYEVARVAEQPTGQAAEVKP